MAKAARSATQSAPKKKAARKKEKLKVESEGLQGWERGESIPRRKYKGE